MGVGSRMVGGTGTHGGHEYWVIGGALALCALTFFGVVVPRYALRHLLGRRPPPLPVGRPNTAGMGIVDVLGVGAVFGMYAGIWLATALGTGEAAAGVELTPALLLGELVMQAMMIGFVVVMLVWRTNLVAVFGLRYRRWWLVPILSVLVVFVMLSLLQALELAGYNAWIADLLGVEDPSQEAVKMLKETKDPLTFGMMALVACVGAPLAEEVVFRGYVYGAVKKLSGIWFSVLFSGLFFAAVHMNVASLLPLFVLGVALAVVYEATGSLWTPIAVHFLFNGVNVAFMLWERIDPEAFEKVSP